MSQAVTLSAGEWRIMERLWERNPQTLMELVRVTCAALPAKKPRKAKKERGAHEA